MQSPTWYLRRLKGMSPDELGWRARSAARDVFDRCCTAVGWTPGLPSGADGFRFEAAPALCRVPLGAWATLPAGDPRTPWRNRLRAEADAVARGRLSFFDLENQDVGQPTDWNREHKSGKQAPVRFAPWIDYRDFRVVGDAKFAWEPNRHHQLTVLGRAYRATGERAYADAVVALLESWISQCPYGMGMNWRSPLELAIRLINWVFTLDLVRDSQVVAGGFRDRLLNSAYQHLFEIARKFSRGSSSNNHLIGEAAGVFVASTFFADFDQGGRWRSESRAILEREIQAQSYPDGGGREQAIGYQLFVLEFFLLAGLVARASGRDFSAAYWARLEAMVAFVGAMSEGGETSPAFGDCDEGRVLDLGGARGDPRPTLAVGAALWGRADFKEWAGGCQEAVWWLLGEEGHERFAGISLPPGPLPLLSREFPESGYYLLQCGPRGGTARISVLFDCGELGFKSIAAHGHADALSFTLRAFGTDILVDPGTYDYFTYPAWRDYFRSTLAHNTVVVDGVDQSVMEGPFLWGNRAESWCSRYEPRPEGGGLVTGEHDGYRRLPDPVTHRRTIELDAAERRLRIQDDLMARGIHDVVLCFHFGEDCEVVANGGNSFIARARGGRVRLQIDPALTVETFRGSQRPILGWVSRGYHRRQATTTLLARAGTRGDATFVTRLAVDEP
jgi:hypothetical protein